MNQSLIEKIRNFTALVGQGAFDLGVNLIVMILVQRSLGVSGLGNFSYFLSLLMFAGFIAEFGISGFLEREIALNPDSAVREQGIEEACRAMLVTNLICGLVFFMFAGSGLTMTRIDERAAGYILIGRNSGIRVGGLWCGNSGRTKITY